MTRKLYSGGWTRSLVPTEALERLLAVPSRWRQKAMLRAEGTLDATVRYIRKNGSTVRHGTFAGVTYPSNVLWRDTIPKLLGTFELELHPVFETAQRRRYDLAVDIGSSEGYYAVGLAKLLQ